MSLTLDVLKYDREQYLIQIIFTYAPVNCMLNVTASITLWLQLLVATRMNKAIETKSNFFNTIHFPPK